MTGWTITCDSGGNCPASINPDTGLAKFQANTGTRDIIYTITYTDENGNCGSTTIRQPGGCSGGGGDTCEGITISGNVNTPDGETFTDGGTLEIGGGTLYFTHSTPSPTPTPTDCDYNWTGQDDDTYNIDLLKKAYHCTVENTDGKNGIICPNDACDADVTVIIINNNTGLSIPFDGRLLFKIPDSEKIDLGGGAYETKFVVQHRDYSNWTEYQGARYPHMQYGAVENQPTNFLVPPNTTKTLKCKFAEGEDICLGKHIEDFYLCFSVLKDHKDIVTHRGIHDKYSGRNYTLETSTNTITKGMTITMTFKSESEFAESAHHKFSASDISRGFQYHSGEVTPLDLYKFKN